MASFVEDMICKPQDGPNHPERSSVRLLNTLGVCAKGMAIIAGMAGCVAGLPIMIEAATRASKTMAGEGLAMFLIGSGVLIACARAESGPSV